MDLKNSIDESDDEEEEFPPLPSELETSNYDNRNNSIDLFYCPSPSFPSPPVSGSNDSLDVCGESIRFRTYSNIRTLKEKHFSDSKLKTKQNFATQIKKKNRTVIGSFFESFYVNLNDRKSETIEIKQENELNYATLMNSTSNVQPSSSFDQLNNHAEYQEIRIASSNRENAATPRLYENVRAARRAPPVPKEVEEVCQKDFSRLYINLQEEKDSPPTLPIRLKKSSSREIQRDSDGEKSTSTTSQRNERLSSETPSDRVESNDKNDFYRRKISFPTNEELPATNKNRQRRTLHSIRRRRLRGSIRASTSNCSNRGQPSRPSSNNSVRHPMVTDDRWRRTLRKRRRQRVLQLRLDGNVPTQKQNYHRPIYDHTYNEIKVRPSPTNLGATGGAVLERAVQFNGALRDRVFSWQRAVQPEKSSSNPNDDSDHKYLTTNEDEDEQDEEGEEEEEEEEFFTHNTFEDFLLRRRPKSSTSTTISATSTVFSHVESIPARAQSRQNIPRRVQKRAPTPPSVRRFPGVALGLDKTDVDFIHNMLQRTRGENRVWNRITALKEAYIRATSKKSDAAKKNKVPSKNDQNLDEKAKKKQLLMKHSFAATKIRAELEKYDELPANPARIREEDEDYYDETSSIDPHPRLEKNEHHRSFPSLFGQTSSTANRIFHFMTSIKRRAQTNVQQLQKNLNEIRSRLQNESIDNVNFQRHASFAFRPKPIIKESPHVESTRRAPLNTGNFVDERRQVRRINSHRSAASVEKGKNFHRTESNSTRRATAVRSSSLIQHPMERRRIKNS